MNNLFSGSSWREATTTPVEDSHVIQMTRSSSSSFGANLDRFFEEVESIKTNLNEIDLLRRSLLQSNNTLKTTHSASAVKTLRAQMDSDVSSALKKAKGIKLRIEELDRGNAENRGVAGCGAGTSTDRTRMTVTEGLRRKMKETMDGFSELRRAIGEDYRETVGRRYYTVTGEKPDEEVVEKLIETGEGERFLQRAIEEQGRGRVVDVIAEIQERHDATRELERSLLELQQVFMDMAVLVASQGEQLNDIELQVGKASSFVQRGTQQLVVAKKTQKNTRKWTCIAILILIVIMLIILIPLLTKK